MRPDTPRTTACTSSTHAMTDNAHVKLHRRQTTRDNDIGLATDGGNSLAAHPRASSVDPLPPTAHETQGMRTHAGGCHICAKDWMHGSHERRSCPLKHRPWDAICFTNTIRRRHPVFCGPQPCNGVWELEHHRSRTRKLSITNTRHPRATERARVRHTGLQFNYYSKNLAYPVWWCHRPGSGVASPDLYHGCT